MSAPKKTVKRTAKARALPREGEPGFVHPRGSFFEEGSPYGVSMEGAATHLRSAEPMFSTIIDAVGPFAMKRERARGTYQSLARAIVYQQLAGKAAATIAGRVCALHDNENFPTPEVLAKLTDEQLRAAGLSANKARALRDLALHAREGRVPDTEALRAMSDGEIVEALTVVRGIGPWTVQMLLMFQLGRPDVFPVDDFGVRHGFQIASRMRAQPARDALMKRAARWAPYRSAAAWYLWRVTDLAKEGRWAT